MTFETNLTFLLMFSTNLNLLRARTTMSFLTRNHSTCRSSLGNLVYPDSDVTRFPVPDDKVKWIEGYSEYAPPSYTSGVLKGKPWADPDLGKAGFNPRWHEVDGHISRISYEGKYEISNGFPLNPVGRTGLAGRGKLGRWGPNHAADPLVTRWKRDLSGNVVKDSNSLRSILQFVAVKRRDNGLWALPGGMVDPGENVSVTAIREFKEEATNSLEMTKVNRANFDRDIDDFFSHGKELTSSYVDDPRNTDNAWMETRVFSFHDESGTTVGRIPLNAGDDAIGVKWVDADKNLGLYASHSDFVAMVAERLGAHY